METGRWSNVPHNERLYKLCNKSIIAKEYYYLLERTSPLITRKGNPHRKYYTRPNVIKFQETMSSSSLQSPKYLVLLSLKFMTCLSSLF